MKKAISYSLFFILLTASICFSQAIETTGCTQLYGKGGLVFSVATGSPGELGLLQAVGEAFALQTGSSLCWVKAGSGESLRLLKQKKVDLTLTHSPSLEKKALAEGWAVKWALFGSNEFFLVGPASDPAAVRGAKTIFEGFARISESKGKFFSRGDGSGTHQREMEIWDKSGLKPGGDWYLITRDFMGPSLKRANNEQGYFLTDSSTWIMEKDFLPKLTVLYRGDQILVNIYHALCQPSGATPGSFLASRFIDFLVSEKGQQIIRDFGKDRFGQGLYLDANQTRTDLD
jgi:tungstate transport system substrate-binding protein